MRQRVVADAPRLGLEPGRAVRHGDGEDRMGAIKAGANLPHIKRLVAAFGAKAMIDGRGLDATGKGGVGEEEQGEAVGTAGHGRSEEHTSELQSLMRIAYAVFCLKKNKNTRRIRKERTRIS